MAREGFGRDQASLKLSASGMEVKSFYVASGHCREVILPAQLPQAVLDAGGVPSEAAASHFDARLLAYLNSSQAASVPESAVICNFADAASGASAATAAGESVRATVSPSYESSEGYSFVLRDCPVYGGSLAADASATVATGPEAGVSAHAPAPTGGSGE